MKFSSFCGLNLIRKRTTLLLSEGFKICERQYIIHNTHVYANEERMEALDFFLQDLEIHLFYVLCIGTLDKIGFFEPNTSFLCVHTSTVLPRKEK